MIDDSTENNFELIGVDEATSPDGVRVKAEENYVLYKKNEKTIHFPFQSTFLADLFHAFIIYFEDPVQFEPPYERERISKIELKAIEHDLKLAIATFGSWCFVEERKKMTDEEVFQELEEQLRRAYPDDDKLFKPKEE